MSASRRDPRKAKLRRERIRREQHGRRAGAPALDDAGPGPFVEHPFATERSMRQIQALLKGQKFGSIDELNTRLAELTRGGRLSEMANAWEREDPKWRAQELAYDALETDEIGEALRLINEALLENRIRLMREVVEKAERNLGEDFFWEQMGHFWGIVSTRPYMRAKQHLGELLAEAGQAAEAISVFERMLELNPNDNQGIRYRLLGLYLASHQPEPANRVMSRYPEEERIMGSFAWARVLERWLSGELDEAEASLARAREVNPFVERYVSGASQLPREAPTYYQPGEESEARVCARELAIAWESHPGFREWLRARREQ